MGLKQPYNHVGNQVQTSQNVCLTKTNDQCEETIWFARNQVTTMENWTMLWPQSEDIITSGT